jgi:hypothetical protein
MVLRFEISTQGTSQSLLSLSSLVTCAVHLYIEHISWVLEGLDPDFALHLRMMGPSKMRFGSND